MLSISGGRFVTQEHKNTRTQEQSNKPIRYLIYGALLLLLFGCSDSYTPLQSNEEEKQVNVISSVIISDSENDPYTVENMNKALRMSIAQKKGVALSSIDANEYKLQPNFLYVRFLANGKQGEAELKKYDTSLVLFKHPMDYKPIQKPAVYIDPSLPDSVTPYFATVPVDYIFGPTKYEIIKELFLAEPDECDNEGCEEEQSDSLSFEKALLKKKRGVSQTTASKLLDLGVSLREIEWTSLKMTDNLKHRLKSEDRKLGENPKMAWSLFSSGKKLGGQLKFEDDILGVQPLVGVRVTGGYSYYWREAHTDKDGNFKIPEKWNFDIDFEANFDNDQFLLEDGHSVYGEDLEIEKNDKHSDWNETFTGNKAKWCVVWTAAYQYYHGEIYGLNRPLQNGWFNQSLDIQVYYKSDNKMFIWWGDEYDGLHASPGVAVWIEINTKNRTSRRIYATTIHELAHSAHYDNMKTNSWYFPKTIEFYNLPTRLKESYAAGMDWFFQGKRYGKYTPYLDRDKGYFSSLGYAGLIEDLIDNNSTYAYDNKKRTPSGDQVSGFTINQIENAFYKSYSWDGLKDNLKKDYPSGKDGRKYTETALNNLFKHWSN